MPLNYCDNDVSFNFKKKKAKEKKKTSKLSCDN